MSKYSWYFYAAVVCGALALVCFAAFVGLCGPMPVGSESTGRWIALAFAFAFAAFGMFVLWPKRFRRTPESREGGPRIP